MDVILELHPLLGQLVVDGSVPDQKGVVHESCVLQGLKQTTAKTETTQRLEEGNITYTKSSKEPIKLSTQAGRS